MGDISGAIDGRNRRQAVRDARGSGCKICMGRKYILVATGKMDQTSTVYERQVCQVCAAEEVIPAESMHKRSPQGDKKAQSGTGYLRNKKRRRKESA
jgi:hypothetical protein